LTEAECEWIADAIGAHRSLLISGGTGSGRRPC
jgi:Flp pilus assembly CpaF family ATPase